MTDAHSIARKTAKRLAPEFGEALPLAVEKVIHGAAGRPGQFDLGALAALAVIATLIVKYAEISIDWKRRNSGKVEIEALKLELRLKLGRPEGLSEKARDAVIEAVAEETETQGGE